MPRADVKYGKWKIFLDGVEVPWINFAVTTGVDTVGEASINMPPDPILVRMRPRTKVHVFMYDEYAGMVADTKDADKQAYKLYWEGEVTDFVDAATPTSRQFTLMAKGIAGGLERSKAYMSGAGVVAATPLVMGSSLLWNEGVQTRELIALSGLADQFKVSKDTDASFADRVIRVLALLASHNAWLRMHVVRTNLFGKLASISDQALTLLVPRVLASEYFNDVGQNIPQEASALEVMARYNNALFHHFVSTTLPVMAEKQPQTYSESLVNPLGAEDERYAIGRLFLRNDYLIIPETYYAIPPSCNLIFPDMQASFSVRRSFDAEPTRAVMIDTQLGTNLAVVAPDSLFRFERRQNMKPEEAWGVNWEGEEVDSPYKSPSGVNLFTALTDGEIERGINPLMSAPPFQVFSGLVNTYDLGDRTEVEKARAAMKGLGDLLLEIQKEDDTGKSYLYMMKTLAEYNLTLLQYTRQVTVDMIGHRWLVPGFPTVILRKEGSYLAWVRTHQFAVDADGNETSAAALDYARPLPKANYELLSKLGSSEKETSEIKVAVRKVAAAYSALLSDLTEGVNALRSTVAAAMKISSALNILSGKRFLQDAYNRLTRQLQEANQEAEKAWQAVIPRLMLSTGNTGAGRDILDLALSGGDVIVEVSKHPLYLTNALSEIENKINEAKSALSLAYSGVYPEIDDLSDPGVLNALDSLRDVISGVGAGLSAAKNAREEFAFPPAFANLQLINTREAEQLYNALLGAQQVFKDSAPGSNVSRMSFGGVSGNLEVAFQNEKAYENYLAYIGALAKIFPLNGEAGTAWGQHTDKTDVYESVKAWEERTFLRRDRTQSLGDFEARHKLELGELTSLAPTPMKFYVLRPASVTPSKSASGKDLFWDDTIFSCIVDEKSLFGRGTDPEIEKLRVSVAEGYLTTTARQEFWIDYASRHWGPRAHDLS